MCYTGSFEHSFGDIQALVLMGPQYFDSRSHDYSILNRFHTLHVSLVFQSNTTENFEYLKTSPMRQCSIMNTFHT